MRPNAARQASIIALTDSALGHVAFMRLDGAAEFGDAIERLLHRLAVLVDGKDLGALAREQHGGGAAVAPAGADAAGAGDQRHLVLKPSGHWKSMRYCEPFRPSFSTSEPHFARSDLM